MPLSHDTLLIDPVLGAEMKEDTSHASLIGVLSPFMYTIASTDIPIIPDRVKVIRVSTIVIIFYAQNPDRLLSLTS